MLPQLKLLTQWQSQVQQQTSAIHESRQSAHGLTPQQEQQLDELARQQGRLAELVLALTAAAPADAPAVGVEPSPGPHAGPAALDQRLEQSLEEALFPDDRPGFNGTISCSIWCSWPLLSWR